MKKNPTTIFIQLLKTNIVKKNMKKEEKKKYYLHMVASEAKKR
jgi:hypothetical protein